MNDIKQDITMQYGHKDFVYHGPTLRSVCSSPIQCNSPFTTGHTPVSL